MRGLFSKYNIYAWGPNLICTCDQHQEQHGVLCTIRIRKLN